MYRSEDVKEAIRIAMQRGNDIAAWNSGMDGKQVVAEAEELFDDLVPVEEWCLVHQMVPIPGRGFCERYELDEDGIEDCGVVRLGAGVGGGDE